jgi:hypothetical protein
VCFQRYGMTVDSCMMQVVRSVGSSGGAVAKQHLDSIWACDRAYEFPPAVKEIVSTGGMVMGTSRRTLGKPMTHGQDRQNGITASTCQNPAHDVSSSRRRKTNINELSQSGATGTTAQRCSVTPLLLGIP